MTSKKQILKTKFSPCSLFATCFGIGNTPFAPGTMGSLFAFPIWFFVNYLFYKYLLPFEFIYIFWAIILAVLFFMGSCAADIYEKDTKSEDPSSIVIDEVVGQLLTLFLTWHIVANYISDSLVFNMVIYFSYFLVSFISFRFFDILKPSFIGVVEKKIKGGYGVMVDDVLAGVAAAIVINIAVFLFEIISIA